MRAIAASALALALTASGLSAGCAARLPATKFDAPGSVLSSVRSDDAYAPYGDAPAVILEHKQRYLLMVFKYEEPYWEEQVHRQVLLRTEKGVEGYANLRIPFHGDGELVDLKARTIAPSGAVAEVTPEQVFDEEASFTSDEGDANVKFRTFRFPRVKVGSVLEYSYTIHTPGIIDLIMEAPSSEAPVERYELELLLSKYIRYDLDVYNLPGKVDTGEEGGLKRIHLKLANIPRVDEDLEYGPHRSVTHPWLSYRTKQYAFSRVVFNMSRTWGDAFKWVGDALYHDNDDKLGGVDVSIDEEGCDGPACLASRAVQLARERAELDGFRAHIWNARPLKKVLATGRASSQEKALLVYKLLRDAGVEVRFAFAARRLTHVVDRSSPNRLVFNHTLLYLPAQRGLGAGLWIDPACESCAPGEIPPWSQGIEALVVNVVKTLRGPKGEADFLPVTGAEAAAGVQRRLHDAVLSASGDLEGTYTLEGQGALAVYTRLDTQDDSDEDAQRIAEEDVKDRMTTGRVLDYQATTCDRAKASCARKVRYRLPAYATADGDQLLLPLSVFNHSWDGLFDDNKRDHDVVITEGMEGVSELRVKLPEGYRPVQLLGAEQVVSDALEYRREAALEGDVLVIKRALRFKPGRYPKERYAALRKPALAFRDMKSRAIVLEKVGDALVDTAPSP